MVVQMPPARPYCVGDVAYKVANTSSSTQIKLLPVTWVDGKWVPSQLGKVMFRDKAILATCKKL